MKPSGHHRGADGQARAMGDVEFWPDGTARLTVQKGKNQPDAADPAASVFGLTGETLANRVSAAARSAGLGEDFSGHSGRIGMNER